MKLRELAESKRDLLYIDPHKLAIENGFNCRQDYGDLDALAADIAQNGVRVPLEVRWDGETAYVVDGHRRHAACLLAIKNGAEILSIPCQSENRGSTPADRLLSQIIRNSGKPLEPFEERELFNRLIGMGHKESDIAKKIGKSVTYVTGRLDLGGATDEVKAAIKDGTVSVSTAAVLSKAAPDKQRAALKEKTGKRLNGHEAKAATGRAAGVRGVKEITAKRESMSAEDGEYQRGYVNALKWVIRKS